MRMDYFIFFIFLLFIIQFSYLEYLFINSKKKMIRF
jgi:hypothetical protein